MSEPPARAASERPPSRRASLGLLAAACLVVGAVLGFASLGGAAGAALAGVVVGLAAAAAVRWAA